MAVTFDGPNLVIILESAVTDVDVQIDLYSDWKEWSLLSDNLKFPQLFRTIGGDPIGGGIFVGAYFFVQNQTDADPGIGGWRIRPPEENITITLTGNIYPEDPDVDTFVTTTGSFNTQIRLATSSLTQAIGSGMTVAESSKLDELWRLQGLDSDNDMVVTSTTRDAGAGVSQTITEAPAGTVTVSRV